MTVNLVRRRETTSYYHFKAQTLQEALQQMLHLGEKDGDGHHAAIINVQAEFRKNLRIGILPGTSYNPQIGWTANAVITHATLVYKFSYRFPKWSNVDKLSLSIQNEWKRYIRCLWVHEKGHAADVQPVLRSFQKQLQQFRIMGISKNSAHFAEDTAQKNLHDQLNYLYDLLAGKTQESINRYDRITGHGRRQGAHLNTKISPVRRERRRSVVIGFGTFLNFPH